MLTYGAFSLARIVADRDVAIDAIKVLGRVLPVSHVFTSNRKVS